MDDVKAWWQSSGVWGSVVAIAASGASLAGYVVTPADQATIVATASHGAELVMQVVTFLGGVVALWGRLRATARITAVAE